MERANVAPDRKRVSSRALRSLLLVSGVIFIGWSWLASSIAPLAAAVVALFPLVLETPSVGKRLRQPVADGLRWLVRALLPRLWRVRTIGLDKIPGKGGAVLVCNRTSPIDPLLLMAIVRRPVHFLVPAADMKRPILGRLLRLLGAVRIETETGDGVLLKSLRRAARHVARGRLLCLFAEGDMTRIGMMLPFRRGVTRVSLLKTKKIFMAPTSSTNFRWMPSSQRT